MIVHYWLIAESLSLGSLPSCAPRSLRVALPRGSPRRICDRIPRAMCDIACSTLSRLTDSVLHLCMQLGTALATVKEEPVRVGNKVMRAALEDATTFSSFPYALRKVIRHALRWYHECWRSICSRWFVDPIPLAFPQQQAVWCMLLARACDALNQPCLQ